METSSCSASFAGLKEVKVDVTNHVATITFFRPNRGNSISSQMSDEVIQALKIVEEDPSVRIIVLTGSGKYFCTGMDLGAGNQNQMTKSLEEGGAAASAIRLYESVRSSKKPVVSRINGPAMGGGWGLVFATDIRIAHKDAWFWFAEVKRGIVPALISAYIAPQIGSFHAKQLMLTGKKVSAQQALQLGFLTAVAQSDEELDRLTNEYTDELLSSAPGAMSVIKATVDYVCSHGHEENVAHVQKVFGQTVHSPEALYGMSCFVQKKKPDWTEFKANL